MIATCGPSLIDLWRRQLGRRRLRDVRPLAALGYLIDGAAIDDLCEIEKLILVFDP